MMVKSPPWRFSKASASSSEKPSSPATMSIVPDRRLASSAAVFSIVRIVMRRNGGFGPAQCGFALEHDVRARRQLADAIGAVVKSGIGRIGVVERADAVLRRVGEGGALEMRRQQHEIVDRRVVEVSRSTCRVKVLSSLTSMARDAAIEFGVADRTVRVAPDLVGEHARRRSLPARRRPTGHRGGSYR